MQQIKIVVLVTFFLILYLFRQNSYSSCSEPAGTGVIWQNCDKSGADLRGSNFVGMTISSCNFSNADMSNIAMNGANYGNNNFTNANLSGASLVGINGGNSFYGANLTNADIKGMTLNDTIFDNAQLINTDLSYSVFSASTSFSGASLSGANLTGTRIHSSCIAPNGSPAIVLTSAQFNSAASRRISEAVCVDLSDFDMTQVISPKFLQVNLSGANLTGADLSLAEFDTVVGLTSAQLRSASKLASLKFTGMDLGGFDLSNIDFLGRPDFYKSFYGSNIKGVNFTNSRFAIRSGYADSLGNSATFDSQYDFTGANLSNAVVMGSIGGANFSNANISGTTFNLFYINTDGSSFAAAPYYDHVDFLNAIGVPIGIGAGIHNQTTCPDGTILNGYGTCWGGVKILVSDNANPGRMYAVHENKKGIYYKTNASPSWTLCNSTGLKNSDILTLITDSTGRLFAGTKDGVHTSIDGCSTWSSMNQGLPN